jgi:hypothetical protein
MSDPRPKAPNARVYATHTDRRAAVARDWDGKNKDFVHSWAAPDIAQLAPDYEVVKDEGGDVVKFRHDVLVRRSRKVDEAERRSAEEFSIDTVKANWLNPDNEAPELNSVDKSMRHVAKPRTPPSTIEGNPELTGG